MIDPYLGEIRLFACDFAPAGWAFCDGQRLRIDEHRDLFQLIGTAFGGDGTHDFALPDLRGRIAVHQDSRFEIGTKGGTETVELTLAQMPPHAHPVMASRSDATSTEAEHHVLATQADTAILPYGTTEPHELFDGGLLQWQGLGYAHTNMQPFVCVNYIISLGGTYPKVH